MQMSNTATESSCTSSKTVTQYERWGGGVEGVGVVGARSRLTEPVMGRARSEPPPLPSCRDNAEIRTLATLAYSTWDDGVTKTIPRAKRTKEKELVEHS